MVVYLNWGVECLLPALRLLVLVQHCAVTHKNTQTNKNRLHSGLVPSWRLYQGWERVGSKPAYIDTSSALQSKCKHTEMDANFLKRPISMLHNNMFFSFLAQLDMHVYNHTTSCGNAEQWFRRSELLAFLKLAQLPIRQGRGFACVHNLMVCHYMWGWELTFLCWHIKVCFLTL